MDEIVFEKTKLDGRPKCVTEDVDRERAAKLRAFARSYGWATSNSPEFWAQPLAILRRNVGSEQVGDVLDWYVCWYKPGRRPKILDGKEFRRHWNWLLQVYQRETAGEAPVPESVAWVLDDLAALEWPGRSATQLRSAVVQSHSSLVRHLRDCRLYPIALRDVVYGVVGEAAEYLREWFLASHKRYAGWREWSGDLLPLVWHPDHPEFERQCREYCRRECGDAGEYDRLKRGSR